jgi:hypothetical protein
MTSVTAMTVQFRAPITGRLERLTWRSACSTTVKATPSSARPMTSVAAVSNLRWP